MWSWKPHQSGAIRSAHTRKTNLAAYLHEGSLIHGASPSIHFGGTTCIRLLGGKFNRICDIIKGRGILGPERGGAEEKSLPSLSKQEKCSKPGKNPMKSFFNMDFFKL